MKGVIYRSIQQEDFIDEIKGSLATQKEEDKFMRSVIDGYDVDEGKIINDAINHGIFSFNPDIMFNNIVKNYEFAKQLYGETILRQLVEDKNSLKIPEVQKKLKGKIKEKFEELKEEGILNKDLEITDKGINLASLSLYIEELKNLEAKGLIGEKINKKISHYGDKKDYRLFKRHDRYRDLAIKKSIKLAIRRGHENLHDQDLLVFERESKGKINVVYALDASGSMKGEKISLCKKAGIALAFRALQEKDRIGLLVFGSEIENVVHPTSDFHLLLRNIANIRAKKETNIAGTILKSIELFPQDESGKHLILMTDAMPTYGFKPEEETLDAVGKAVHYGITISVIGINLDKKGEKLSEQITQIGDGNFYIVKDLKELDSVVLMDYYSR